MMQVKKILPFLLVLVVFIAAQTFAKDYFLYDAEGQKILYMGGKSTEFVEKLELNKNPDYLMPTDKPDKFLAIYVPEVEEGKKGLFGRKKTDTAQLGQLILFNVNTGRTEDLVELGYGPFTYHYTEDHKHLVIVYRTSPAADSTFELLYYNIAEQKNQKLILPKLTKVVNQILISPESKLIYLLLDNTKRELTKKESGIFAKKQEIIGTPELVKISFSPLAIINELPLESCPLDIYQISPNRIVLVCQDYRTIIDAKDSKGDFTKPGFIRIINPKDNSIINEYKTSQMNIYRRWYKKEKVLILNFTTEGTGFMMVGAKEIYLKVSPTEVVTNEFTKPTGNFEYLVDKNCLYIITSDNLTVIDYKTGITTPYETGSNGSYGYYYNFLRLPETDLAVIYQFEKSTVKFFDLKENKLIKKVSCGRGGVKIFSSIFRGFLGYSTGTETTISISPDKSKFFIFNKLSDDITVYDQNYEKQTYIVFKDEKCLGMFLVKKPALQTILVTNKKILKLDYENNALIPLYNFPKKVEDALLFSDETRTFVLSDNEIVVLDSQNLEVKNNFKLIIDKNDKYTNLKPGEQRYYFIPSL
jgi:WD40 repeat protein